MAETTQIMFSHKDTVTALIKAADIHEGIWMLAINFGLGATNVGQMEDGSDINPAAIIPVLKLGLQRADKLSAMAVDASEVNPKK